MVLRTQNGCSWVDVLWQDGLHTPRQQVGSCKRGRLLEGDRLA